MKLKVKLLAAFVGVAFHSGLIGYQVDPLRAKGDTSLLLFCLEKSVVSMERYAIDEVRDDMNYCSRQSCSNRVVFAVDFTEPGEIVRSISIGNEMPDRVHVMVKTSDDVTCYAMNWMSVAALQEAMHDVIVVTCDAFPRSTKKVEDAERHEDDASWCSLVEASWHIEDMSFTTNFVFDRRIKSATGVFVANSFLAQQPRFTGKLSKEQALAAGIIWETDMPTKLDEGDGLDIEDESEDILFIHNAVQLDGSDATFEDHTEVDEPIFSQLDQPEEPADSGCPFASLSSSESEKVSWLQSFIAYILSWFKRR